MEQENKQELLQYAMSLSKSNATKETIKDAMLRQGASEELALAISFLAFLYHLQACLFQ